MASLRRDQNQQPADFRMTTNFVATIPVSQWTALMRRLTRSRPLHVSVDNSYGFRHPWHCRGTWSPGREQWQLDIHPGYCNHLETLVRVDGRDAPPATLARLGLKGTPKGHVEAWLSESPPLLIPPSLLRPIGDDPEGLGGESIPDYFRPLGVGSEEYETTTDLEALTRTVSLTGDFPDASTRRRLRVCELVLAQPRAALRLAYGEDLEGPTLQMDIATPADPSPTLSLRRAWTGTPPQSGIEALLSGATDNGIDEKHIATVYLLSPIGAAIDAVPDPTWQLIVQHRTWWNQKHEVNQFLESIPDQRLGLPGLGLAGGVGDALIAGAIQSSEAALNQAQALLDRSRIEGRFWSV
jgi:hypothetical protein